MALGIMDIVALAKAGYSVNDVKELIALAKAETSSSPSQDDQPSSIDHTPHDDQKGDHADDSAVDNPTASTADNSAKNDNQDLNINGSDDQKKIVDYKEKIAALEEKLSKLQSDNTHQNMADAQKSDSEVLADLARSFM
jgi:hypothetical protein